MIGNNKYTGTKYSMHDNATEKPIGKNRSTPGAVTAANTAFRYPSHSWCIHDTSHASLVAFPHAGIKFDFARVVRLAFIKTV